MSKIKLFKAEIPEIIGYGIYGTGDSVAKAVSNCRKMYKQIKKENCNFMFNPDIDSFNKAWEYFGGHTHLVEDNTYGYDDTDIYEDQK